MAGYQSSPYLRDEDDRQIDRPVITEDDLQEGEESLGSNPFTVSTSFNKLETGEAPSIFSGAATGTETVFGRKKNEVPQKKARRLTNVPTGHCIMCGTKLTGRFVRIRDNGMHNQCFTCATCNVNLKGQGYFEVKLEFYCRGCNPNKM